MSPSRPQLVAVDTNVLLDLAEDCEDVLDAMTTIRRRLPASKLIVSPTTLQELAQGASNPAHPKRQAMAIRAMKSLLHPWNIRPMNLVPAGHGIVERIGERLLERGLIPPEERHDAFILAEAALLGCSILLSSDQHLRAVDYELASLELKAADVDMPLVATPREIVRKFFQR